MRYFALLVIAALAALTAISPAPDAATPLPEAGAELPSVAVCPIQEGSGRSTTLAVLSTVDGPVELSLFTGGGTAGTLATSTGTSGSTLIPVGDIAAVGTVGGLIELPNPSSTAGAIVSGASSLMTEACTSTPAPETLLVGGSTVAGETFSIQLMNPYAGEAIVSLRVASEAGIESNERFDSMIVPPRSSEIVDFNALLPGRESLSVNVITELGRVVAVGQQGVEGESSIWNGVAPAQDWFLPIPSGQPSRTLLIGTTSTLDIEYQVDFYGPEGLDEALITGSIPANGQVAVDLDEVTTETSAVRVVSNGPVVPVLRIEAADGFATTVGSAVEANRWMLPGASPPPGGWASVVILNASIEDSTVSVRPLREGSTVRDLSLQSDDVVELALEQADGYLIESTSPVVVIWVARTGVGTAAAIGVPLDDG